MPLALNIQWFNCSLSLSAVSNPSLLSLCSGSLLLGAWWPTAFSFFLNCCCILFSISSPLLLLLSLFIRIFIQPCPESLCSKQVPRSHATAEANNYESALEESDEELSHNFLGKLYKIQEEHLSKSPFTRTAPTYCRCFLLMQPFGAKEDLSAAVSLIVDAQTKSIISIARTHIMRCLLRNILTGSVNT